MFDNIVITGFGDEIDPLLDKQMAVLEKLQMNPHRFPSFSGKRPAFCSAPAGKAPHQKESLSFYPASRTGAWHWRELEIMLEMGKLVCENNKLLLYRLNENERVFCKTSKDP